MKAAYRHINEHDLWLTVTSVVLGVGILVLPRYMAEATYDADGWISILVAGIFTTVFAWMCALLASRFPGMMFADYTAKIAGRYTAKALSGLFAIFFLLIASFEVSMISKIAMQYLFVRTPIEVIGLVFLLIVIYAVAGSRVGLLRLNVIFTPIVLLIVVLLLVINIGFIELANLRPFLTTSMEGYIEGFNVTIMSLSGAHILLFYVALLDRPERAPRMAVKGMVIPVILYVLLYLMAIGIFGQTTTADMSYPTIDLAKEVLVPGEFFERFESVFFTIWIMTIFNTTAMAYDLVVLSLTSLFSRVKKFTFILMLAPVIFIISMLPETMSEVDILARIISIASIIFGAIIPFFLLMIAKWRNIRGESR